MLRSIILYIVVFYCLPDFATAQDQVPQKEVYWQAFRKNLVKAIAPDNEGVQISAMRHIIRYSDKLNVKNRY